MMMMMRIMMMILLVGVYRLPIPRPGEVLGLVGTNGIGKSTALKILAGKQKPNLGRYGVSIPTVTNVIITAVNRCVFNITICSFAQSSHSLSIPHLYRMLSFTFSLKHIRTPLTGRRFCSTSGDPSCRITSQRFLKMTWRYLFYKIMYTPIHWLFRGDSLNRV